MTEWTHWNRVALHEAGHAVVAEVVGYPMQAIELWEEDSDLGDGQVNRLTVGKNIPVDQNDDDISADLFRDALAIIAAGDAATAALQNNIRYFSLRRFRGADLRDYTQVMQACAQQKPPVPLERGLVLLQREWTRARDILTANRRSVDALVCLLDRERASISGDDLAKLVLEREELLTVFR